MVLPRFQFIYPFYFSILFVASKGWRLAAEVAFVVCCFIGFNLLIWSQSVCELNQEVLLITYGWNREYLKIMRNNEMAIKAKKMTTQDQVILNIFSFLLGQSDPLGYWLIFILLFLLKFIQSS